MFVGALVVSFLVAGTISLIVHCYSGHHDHHKTPAIATNTLTTTTI
jgi:hypothetical protein